MNYRLAILTHGTDGQLDRTLPSFFEYVYPHPSEIVVYHDGGMLPLRRGWEITGYTFEAMRLPGGPPKGFCAATRQLWKAAAEPGPSLVFWLEHDFEFFRTVDLRDAATVLADNPQIAQIALMRDAVNAEEKAAGGLWELRREQYEFRFTKDDPALRVPWVPWMEHSAYFTTTPSLMLRSFMEANPWPTYGSECEGRFGIDLRSRGFSFGVMGQGEPWVRHVGVRSGFGY